MIYQFLSTQDVLSSYNQENTPPQSYDSQYTPSLDSLSNDQENNIVKPRCCRSEHKHERSANILRERQDNINQESHRASQEDHHKQHKEVSHKGRNENSFASSLKKDQLAQIMNQRKLQKYTIKQLIHISKSNIDFGNIFSGQVVDESLDIVNKTNQNLVVEIALGCENPDFQDADEYVYSIRRSHLFEFNDKHYLVMAPYSSASFRVTLKAPMVKKSCSNRGFVDISIQGLKSSHKIVLDSNIKAPKVTCPKALYHKKSRCKMVRIAVKQGKKQECKIPLRNEGDVPVTIDFSFYRNEEMDRENENVDCCVVPGTLTIPANGTAYFNFVTRTKKIDRSQNETRTMEKKILLGKVKDTNLIYSFFFCIETY